MADSMTDVEFKARQVDQLPLGREDDYVLFHPSGHGWVIHKGSRDEGTDYTLTIHMMSMGRTSDNEWWIAMRSGRCNEFWEAW